MPLSLFFTRMSTHLYRLFPGIIGLTATVGLIILGVSVPQSRDQVITALAGTGGGFWGYIQRTRDDEGRSSVARQDSGTIVVAAENTQRDNAT